MDVETLRRTFNSIEPAARAAERAAEIDLRKAGVLRAAENARRAAATVDLDRFRAKNVTGFNLPIKGEGPSVAGIFKGIPKPGSDYRKSYSGIINSIGNPARNASPAAAVGTPKYSTGLFGKVAYPAVSKHFSESFGRASGAASYTPPFTLGLGRPQGFVSPELPATSKNWMTAFGFPKDATNSYGFSTASQRWKSFILPENHPLLKAVHDFETIGDRVGGFVRAWQTKIERIGRLAHGILGAIERFDWAAVEKAILVQAARRPRTQVGFAALNAYDALYRGLRRKADAFLVEYLKLPPNAYYRHALWVVLRSAFENSTVEPKAWLTLEDRDAIAYLRVAVWKEAYRAKRDWEMTDRIWWAEGEKEFDEDGVRFSKPAMRADDTLDLWLPHSPGPEDLAISSQPDERPQVLELLLLDGTPRDQEIVKLIRTGEHEFKDIAKSVGSTKMQSFQRKAQRWRENKVDRPEGG